MTTATLCSAFERTDMREPFRTREKKACSMASRLLLLFALFLPPVYSNVSQECDCQRLVLTQRPVCGANGVDYINHCVAQCQGVEVLREGACSYPGGQHLYLKSSPDSNDREKDLGEAAAAWGPAAAPASVVEYSDPSRVDVDATINMTTLNRFQRLGYTFSAKVVMKGEMAPEPGMADAGEGELQEGQLSPRIALAARVTQEGHLYLKVLTLGAAEQLALPDMQAVLEGSVRLAFQPPQLPQAAPPLAGRRLERRRLRRKGRRLRIDGSDGRVEILSSEFPYSAVGLVTFVKPSGCRSTCSGALIGPRHVLTAGHCVYDTESRQPYDISSLHFYANMQGGDMGRKVHVTDVLTYWQNAKPPTKCASSDKKTCQSREDFQWDFAVLSLEEDLGAVSGFLGYGYVCGRERYKPIRSAGYPADLNADTRGELPYRMYLTSGSLTTFDACSTALSDQVVESTLDVCGGQSGAAVWDSNYVVRALVNLEAGANGLAGHRTISEWVFNAIESEVEDPLPAGSGGSSEGGGEGQALSAVAAADSPPSEGGPHAAAVAMEMGP